MIIGVGVVVIGMVFLVFGGDGGGFGGFGLGGGGGGGGGDGWRFWLDSGIVWVDVRNDEEGGDVFDFYGL